MSKISELSDGGSLQSTDFLIAVRSGGNVKVQADGAVTGTTGQFSTSLNVDGTVTADGLTVDGTLGSFAVQASGAEVHFSRNENNDLLANGGTSASLTVGANNNLIFKTGASLSEVARIDSSGNVGIGSSTIDGFYGSSSVSTRAAISYSSASTDVDTAPKGLVVRNDNPTTSNLSQMVFGTLNTGNTPIAVASIYSINGARTSGFSTGSLGFGTVGGSGIISERMRIDSSGNLLVGTTSTLRSNKFHVNASNFVGGFNVTNGTGEAVSFFSNGTVVGTVTVTGSATAYNTSSDARLKENIADAEDASSLVDAIQVRSFDWKADGLHQRYGMVAQELLEVAPEAVSQGETEDDMMGVDYSKLVPMLVKEIQSLRARVAQLEGA